MSFNKKILALAIASALPGLSHAVYSLDGLQPGTAVFADEIAVVPFNPGTSLQNKNGAQPVLPAVVAAGNLTVQNTIGFSIVGSSKYVRFNYPGTRMTRALLPTDFSVVKADGSAFIGTISISQFGGADDSSVIIEIAAPLVPGVSNNDIITFVPPAGALSSPAPIVNGVRTASKTDHTISYALYNTPTDAQNQLNALVSKASAAATPWYKFQQSLLMSCNQNGLAPSKIDVLNPTQFKTNPSIPPILGSIAQLFNLEMTLSSAAISDEWGDPINLANLVPVGTSVQVNGNFFDPTGATIFAGINTVAPVAFGIDPTAAAFALLPDVTPALPLNGTSPTSTFFMQTAGIIAMTPSNYGVVISRPLPGGTVTTDLGVCASLTYSGSSDRIDLGLTPTTAGGVNKQWFRITNPSDTGGNVAVTVWNDAGARVDFPLSTVLVGPAPGTALPNILGAQSSTPLFTVDQVYAAAQSIDAGFSVGTGVDGKPGKLRVEVRGEFGDDALDSHLTATPPFNINLGAPTVSRLKNGIYIQAVSSATVYQSH